MDEVCWPTCRPTAALEPPTFGASGTQEVWEPMLLNTSGAYTICWCNGKRDSCDSDEDFVVKVGEIQVSEALWQHVWHCAVGTACTVVVPATGALSDLDWMQLVESAPGAACGETEPVDGASFSRGTRIRGYSGTTEIGTSTISFILGDPQEVKTYQVCYCPQYGACSLDSDFFQLAGMLVVSGLSSMITQQHLCYVGTSCVVGIEGVGLSAEDGLLLVKPDQECGAVGEILRSSFNGARLPTTDGSGFYAGSLSFSANAGPVLQLFELGEAYTIEHFKLCYCVGRFAAAGACQKRSDFVQSAGIVHIRGPQSPRDAR